MASGGPPLSACAGGRAPYPRWVPKGRCGQLTITHDMDFVARHFQRVLVFQEGRVVADGTAEEVFAQDELLDRAGLEAPQITRLGRALDLPQAVLTVEAFVEAVLRAEGRTRS